MTVLYEHWPPYLNPTKQYHSVTFATDSQLCIDELDQPLLHYRLYRQINMNVTAAIPTVDARPMQLHDKLSVVLAS